MSECAIIMHMNRLSQYIDECSSYEGQLAVVLRWQLRRHANQIESANVDLVNAISIAFQKSGRHLKSTIQWSILKSELRATGVSEHRIKKLLHDVRPIIKEKLVLLVHYGRTPGWSYMVGRFRSDLVQQDMLMPSRISN